jgi:hypothetical protein
MAVRAQLHNSAGLMPKKEPLYLWVRGFLGSGIELDALIAGNVIIVAVNRIPVIRPIVVSFISAQSLFTCL